MNKTNKLLYIIEILAFLLLIVVFFKLTTIIFSPSFNDQANIFCYGSEAIRLTENNTNNDSPIWSPDSKWIAYIESDNGEQINLINPKTNEIYRITDNQGYDFEYGAISWSPGGKKILLPVVYYSDVFIPSPFNSVIIDIQDSINQSFIQPDYGNLESTIPGYPVGWGPDGNSILVMNNQIKDDFDSAALYIYNYDDNSIFQVSLPSQRVWGASWSPNGEKIAYSASKGEGDTEIYMINVDGTDLIQLTDNAVADINPIWSADGKYIAFTTNINGNWDIYALSVRSKNIIQITDNPHQEVISSWNIDNIIAFTANWNSPNPQDIIENENVYSISSDDEIYIMKLCIE